MKKIYIYGLTLSLILSAATVLAEEQNGNDNPPPLTPPSFQEQIRAKVRDGQDYRNGLLKSTTSVNDDRGDRPPRPEDRPVFMGASTTPDGRPVRINDDRFGSSTGTSTRPGLGLNQENRERERLNLMKMLEARKENMSRQLTQALNNLKQVSDRIGSRIEKAEQSGRTMTDAKNLLATASAKITAAQTAIDAFKAYVPATSTATTTPPDMTQARTLLESARSAIKDARNALQKVVISIAHNMGLKLGDDRKDSNGTSTATTTP